jgi:hypothetical protein
MDGNLSKRTLQFFRSYGSQFRDKIELSCLQTYDGLELEICLSFGRHGLTTKEVGWKR